MWPLHTAPLGGWAGHQSHSSNQSHQSATTLIPFKEPACPPQRASKGTCKVLPEFLFWPLTNFYWLKSPRTWVRNRRAVCSGYKGILMSSGGPGQYFGAHTNLNFFPSMVLFGPHKFLLFLEHNHVLTHLYRNSDFLFWSGCFFVTVNRGGGNVSLPQLVPWSSAWYAGLPGNPLGRALGSCKMSKYQFKTNSLGLNLCAPSLLKKQGPVKQEIITMSESQDATGGDRSD